MQISKNFLLQEFVPKAIYKLYEGKSTWFINPKIIQIAQELRYASGVPIIINNWHIGGVYNQSGYRVPETVIGAKLSQHKLGNAIDVRSNEVTPIELMNVVLSKKDLFMQLGLTAMEDVTATKSWLHLDCRFVPQQKEIIIFKP